MRNIRLNYCLLCLLFLTGCLSNEESGTCGGHGDCKSNFCSSIQGICIEHPCGSVDCGGVIAGVCVVSAKEQPLCQCEMGYQADGLICKKIENTSCDGVTCGVNSSCVSGVCQCDQGYHLSENICASNTRKVNCSDLDPLPENSTQKTREVEIIWDNGSWSNAPQCDFQCNEGYERDGDQCVYDDPCDGITCQADSVCEEGSCVCKDQYINQNGFCVADPEKIIQNCSDGMCDVSAGWFWMGCSESSGCAVNESPYHAVYLNAFKIDQYEVKVEDIMSYSGITVNSEPLCNYNNSDNRPDEPVNCVTKLKAQAYCKSIGKRLPTEAEWEKAARGIDERVYPWGDLFSGEYAIYATDGTGPAGSIEAGKSPYGLYDMAGNLYEWCQDLYDAEYYQNTPQYNPVQISGGECGVVRGGSYKTGDDRLITYDRECKNIYSAAYDVGFRCVKDVE